MWRLERQRDVLLVGRLRVERWAPGPGGRLVRAKAVDLMAGPLPEPQALEPSIGTVLEGGSRAVDVVVESAWLPVIAVRTGQALWARSSVEALARHRLAEGFGDLIGAEGRSAQSAWDIVVDHRPGDEVAVAYGLPQGVSSAIERAVTGPGVHLRSMQPALAWGWQEAGSRAGWWVWLEQDRAHVCHVTRGRIDAMNAGAMFPADAASCQRLLAVEGIRQGLADTAVAKVAGLELPFASPADGSLVVTSLGGPDAGPRVTASQAAGVAA